MADDGWKHALLLHADQGLILSSVADYVCECAYSGAMQSKHATMQVATVLYLPLEVITIPIPVFSVLLEYNFAACPYAALGCTASLCMTQLWCCSHLTQMPLKGAGVLGLLVHSREQLTPLPPVLSFSNDRILRQEQCCVQMQQPLVEMPQILDLVLIEALLCNVLVFCSNGGLCFPC